jgi:U1 small nuclear ribonucleoprotein C
VHGAQGDHRKWAGVEAELKEKLRWINFVVPGFDGLDERRGNYTGSAEDLSKLIVAVLEQRRVSKIVYVGHSMGSIFGGYFISKHPEMVVGYVNVTGIVNYWYVGLMTFYRNLIVTYGFGPGTHHSAMMRLLNKN